MRIEGALQRPGEFERVAEHARRERFARDRRTKETQTAVWIHCLRTSAVALAFLTSLVPATEGNAYEFEVKGELKRTDFFYGKGAQTPKVVSFVLYVRNCQWLIRTIEQDQATKYFETSCDGEAEYKYVIDEADPSHTELGGMYRPDLVPYQAKKNFASVLWLAYASSCYLDNITNYMVPPYSDEAKRPLLAIEMSRRQDSLRLPSRIVFYTTGKAGEAATSHSSVQDALYEAQSFPNQSNMDLPLAFKLTRFRTAGPGEDSSRLWPSVIFEASVDLIKTNCSITEFIPKHLPGRPFTVLDYRLQLPGTTPDYDALWYKSNKWPVLAELTNLADFPRFLAMREKVHNARGIVTRRGQSRPLPTANLVMRVVFLTFAIAGGALIAQKAWRARDGTQQQ